MYYTEECQMIYILRGVTRYQRGNQNPYIKEEHNGQK